MGGSVGVKQVLVRGYRSKVVGRLRSKVLKWLVTCRNRCGLLFGTGLLTARTSCLAVRLSRALNRIMGVWAWCVTAVTYRGNDVWWLNSAIGVFGPLLSGGMLVVVMT